MNNVIDFIQSNMNFLNDIQSYHWQTESYSEHETTGEYYEKLNKLNDEFVETWQGKTDTRIKFSAELRPGIMNYASNSQVVGEVKKQASRITEISQHEKVKGQIDLESILEEMLIATNQLLFHLSLKYGRLYDYC